MGLVGWLLRVWEPSSAAYCSSCGSHACGILTSTGAVACEHCGKRWNLTPRDRELTEEIQ